MEQRNLGKSGLRVSVVGLGCNNFGGRIDFDATKNVVHKAFDLGITFFDEADTYGDPRGSSASTTLSRARRSTVCSPVISIMR